MSLRAKHSVGPGIKKSGDEVPQSGDDVPLAPEADHADDILQFNAQICKASASVFLAVLLKFVMAFIYCQK